MHARYDAVLPAFMSIVLSNDRPVILLKDNAHKLGDDHLCHTPKRLLDLSVVFRDGAP